MKLMLFSDQSSVPPEKVGNRLAELVNKEQPIVGYISSCPDKSRQFYQQAEKYYSQFQAVLSPYLDLEDGFSTSVMELVFQADAIHLSGGNTFRFMYWILQRGLKEQLIRYVDTGGILIGVSAGSIIMTPNISISKLCDDKNEIGLENLAGLNLVNFHYLPHAVSHRVVAKDIILKSKQEARAIVLASDRDWIVINETKCEIHGVPKLIVKGKISDIENLCLFMKNNPLSFNFGDRPSR